MDVKPNIPLRDYTTMHLGGNASLLGIARLPAEIAGLYHNAKKINQSAFIIGGGSNLIVHDEGFSGLVIVNRIKGFEIIKDEKEFTTIKIGSGETWDKAVERTVEMNLTGIEALSAIPGTVGAAPVQNIGAYGQELADSLISLEAYDTVADNFVQLDASACGFSYRHSIFRGEQTGRYAITSITLRLFKGKPQPPFYDSLQKYLSQHNITEYTPANIRAAVIAIRADKLPDPAKLPSAGSFFKNTILETWKLNEIKEEYPDIPAYKMDGDHYKLSSGWLIEQTGLKGQLLNGMRVHTGNALVLINESAKGYSDLADARDEIIKAVQDQFKITLEQEPLEMPIE
jgi:UDP-N-acetylmuramate dehydrogenase